MEYEKLLEEAYKKIKPIESKERFEVPKATGLFEGNKTIISNFLQISSYIRRQPEHFAKFLLKELATSGSIEGDRLVLQTKIPSLRINEKIASYIDEFVICKECKKPDTTLEKQGNFNFMHCMACGAKKSVRI
jgi:translation initiation factor 2 subunit 2